MLKIEIDLTPEQQAQLENLASQQGYPSIPAYVRALVESELNEPETDDPLEDFRQGWHEAMTGQTYPASTLWDDLDEE